MEQDKTEVLAVLVVLLGVGVGAAFGAVVGVGVLR
jgi:hypothetical protein